MNATDPHAPPAAGPTRPAARQDERAFGQLLRAREPEALERFFDEYFEPVFQRVSRLVRNTQEAEDLTQEIFLSIHRSLPNFDPARPLRPWVGAITMNRVRDHWRSRGAQPDVSSEGDALPPNAGPPPESDLERREREGQLRQAVYRLPLGLRSVLLLRTYDGLGFDVIATMLEITVEAARKRYSRAVQTLRRELVVRGMKP